ncbi:MAG TPA: phosphate ABC transporter substrate-binding protein PstS [Bacteroidota bacterium]|nr:phosphate ABC transporter substrate-binding protein PstS [Bacteroidota bacterium]
MNSLKIAVASVLLIAAAALPASAQLKLNGAGATFPYVIYSKWFDTYHTKTGIEFNYQSIGSGGGIKQVTAGTVDFGASDAFLSEDQMKEIQEKQGTPIIHIPTVMGAVVVTYNLPAAGTDLKLTQENLAEIYLGTISSWDDPKLKQTNPGKNLPSTPILVAHRSDGSGTTNIFTNYLSKVSPAWKEKVGEGVSVNWPVGLGGKGNEGVAGLVKQSEGAIGYVELAYAVQNKMPYAALRNKAGVFVNPSFDAVSAAAAGAAKKMPADLRVMLTDADGKDSYPICGFTWLLIYQNMKDKEKATAMTKFLAWAMTEGQQYAKDLYYAPLPPAVAKLCEKKIAMIEK